MEEFSHALAYIKLSASARSMRMQKQQDTKEQAKNPQQELFCHRVMIVFKIVGA